MSLNPGRPAQASHPSVVLGVSDSHDAGATLIVDGRIVAAVNEERLNRHKQSAGFPAQSIGAVFKLTGIDPRNVERVGLAGRVSFGEPPVNNDYSMNDGSERVSMYAAEALDALPGVRTALRSSIGLAGYQRVMPLFASKRLDRICRLLADLGVNAEMRAFDHHDAHVASAYFTSGEPECLILSNDGYGDAVCAKVSLGSRGRLTELSRNTFFNSIGLYYNYVTHFCGFPKIYHAGKTTGLAAFGNPARTIDAFREMIHWDEARGIYVNDGPAFRQGLRAIHERFAGMRREDVAAGMQRHLEEVVVAMARHYMRRTGQRRLALVGGIHANVRANQKVGEIDDVERVFVFPNMGDGGLSAGAAFLAWAGDGSPVTFPPPLEHVYLGNQFGEREITEALARHSLPFERPANLARAIAEHLAHGRIVARFDGAMEYGPRALGNRSILCAATDASVNSWLNERLKRTEFMPFAPVVREPDAPEFFRNVTDATRHAAEFMTITYDATERCRKEAPAIVHVDGTARPQIIRRAINPGYFDILTEYQKLTGLSVLVNTSFNMHEEPIVCTPDDAARAYVASSLDVLAAGPFLVRARCDSR